MHVSLSYIILYLSAEINQALCAPAIRFVEVHVTYFVWEYVMRLLIDFIVQEALH